jgi:anti-sigma28 factor (negative regulator of flagellin synthesis)
MSQINGVGNNNPVQRVVGQPVYRQVSTSEAQGTSAADKLELSGVSHLFNTLKSNDIRADKVASVRAQIEAGTYETDDKLTIAADRLLDDISR